MPLRSLVHEGGPCASCTSALYTAALPSQMFWTQDTEIRLKQLIFVSYQITICYYIVYHKFLTRV